MLVKPSGPGFVWTSNFLITASMSLIAIGCSGLLLLLHPVLGYCMFPEICPFCFGCPVSWHIVVHINFLQSLLFLCYFSSFISDFIYLILSLFFLISLVKGLSILFYFSKNQLLDSLILTIVLLVSMSFNSALILVVSFLLIILGYVYWSSSSFRCRVRFLIWDFSVFFR